MTPALARLVEALNYIPEQVQVMFIPIEVRHAALAAVAQEGAIVGERTAEEPRTLPSSAFSIAQAEPEPKGVKMGDCPHGRNDWSVCTYCSQVLQADLTSARAALRLAQILFHGIQCQCEWCQHPAVQAALKEKP